MRSAVGILILIALVNANDRAVSHRHHLPSECSYSAVYENFMRIASIGCDYEKLRESCCHADRPPLDSNFQKCIKIHYGSDEFCRFRVSMNNDIYKHVSSMAEATVIQKVATMLFGAVTGLFF
uniref:Domain of unknown function DB domain-containing protein n=1 Tax=Panagrellus redivivus TaxID=6233 RepID=A0A7E4WA22_PANRE